LDGHILKARVHSDDPVTDLADRVLDESPACAIFEIVNDVANAPVKAIDTSEEPDQEPDIAELFMEWRTSTASRITAPHDEVAAMFARAIGDVPANGTDLGFDDIAARARTALEELTETRTATGRGS
jgi:hypothetical protein